MKAFRASVLLCLIMCSIVCAAPPKNVIFFIGDGMGPEQVYAAECYAGKDMFSVIPYKGEATTYCANNAVTDSAAAATALATGVKVNYGVVSMAIYTNEDGTPADGSELETLLEYFQLKGKEVGLVTTAYLTHATPAAFGAHETSRNNYSAIAGDYLTQTKPNVLFGGGGNGLTVTDTVAAGYTVVTDSASFSELVNLNLSDPYISAQFGTAYMPYRYDNSTTYPDLASMTTAALTALSDDPDGFFLMIEAGRIDHACHDNHLQRSIHETIDLDNAVTAAFNMYGNDPETLIIVTADHETGGLTVTEDNGPENYPTVTWSSEGHTAANVPVYAWGVNSELIVETMDNIDIYTVCIADTGPPPAMQITPSDTIVFRGAPGGPFTSTPSSPEYTVSNTTSDQVISWTADVASGIGIFAVTPSTGSLTAGNSESVIVSLTEPESIVLEGNYTGSILLTDTTNNETVTKDLRLEVRIPRALADSDVAGTGTVAGTYQDTHGNDTVYQAITEIKSSGRPPKISYLEHTWTVSLPSDTVQVEFHLDAHRSGSYEGDTFEFSFSTDGSTFIPMVTVTETSTQHYTCSLADGVSGVVYIRVKDTDQEGNESVLDTIYINHMSIRYLIGEPAYGVTVSIDEASQRVQPGDSTNYTIRVSNSGGIAGASYDVSLVADDSNITITPSNWTTGVLGTGDEEVQIVSVDTVGVPEGTYTLTATSTSDQDTAATDTAQSELVVSTETANVLSATSTVLIIPRAANKKHTFVSGEVTITVVDLSDDPVEGVTVSGRWSGTAGASDVDTGVTDSSGSVTFTSDEIKNPETNTTFIFTLTEVSKADYDSPAQLPASVSGTYNPPTN